MARLRSNFQRGSLSANAASGDTTLTDSVGFTALRVVAAPDYLMIVLDPDAVHGNPEIVKVTAHTSSAATVTVTRAQEGTSARSHNSSTTWRHVPTSQDWNLATTRHPLSEWGVVGDNSTDDTTGVQNAINDAMADGFGLDGVGTSGTQFKITSTLDFIGSNPLSLWGAHQPDSTATFFRNFDGPLFQIERSVDLRNLMLYDASSSTTRSGAALNLTATGSTRRAQYSYLENVRVTSDVAGGAWERDLILDGPSWTGGEGAGIRNTTLVNCYFFGARTAGETVKIDSSTNVLMIGGQVNGAPTAITQGIKIVSNISANMHFVGVLLGGNFSSDGDAVTFTGGQITGNCTFTSSATNSFVHAYVLGTITQSSSTNCTIQNQRNIYGQKTLWNSAGSAAVLAARTVGDTSDRLRMRADGLMFWSDGAGGSLDTNLYRQSAGVLRSDQKLVANTGLGAGNSASASSLGTVVKKLQIFDSAGNSLGYLPIYDAIS